jgi:transcription initiation factor TFIID subunit 1
MPHAMDDLEESDDAMIARLIAGSASGQDDPMAKVAGEIMADGLGEDGGEKADDALDYGDISDDDDLPDEEDAPAPAAGLPTNGHGGAHEGQEQVEGAGDEGLFGDGDGDGDGDDDIDPDFDALFNGDGEEDLTMQDAPNAEQPATNGHATQEAQEQQQGSFDDDLFGDGDLDGSVHEDTQPRSVPKLALPDEEDPDPAAREQARMFREARERADRLNIGGLDPDAQIAGSLPVTNQELLDEFYPSWDPEEIPYYGQMFMRRRAHYMKKTPFKVPTKTQPTRSAFDLEADQERAFKLSGGPKSRKRSNEEANDAGLYFVQADEQAHDLSDDNIELASLHDEEMIGGVSLQDLRVLCEDWDSFSVKSANSDVEVMSGLAVPMTNGFDESPQKRRKTSLGGLFESIARDDYPLFDDPEALTAKLAKRIPLDMNDSHLLLDFSTASAREASAQTSFVRRREAGGVSSAIHKKFNFSNDDEYERLVKENSIRGAVGNIPIEHSGPARRLQYPYYKTTLSHREQRNFHRPALHFPPNGRLNIDRRLEHKKIKEMRKLAVGQAFAETKDLTLADNSSMMLLEYSEEMPLMMNNFGMNSRIINYYRRKDEHDKFRPKEDVGEPRVLQEKDQSPFVKFGFVDPGQTMPTLHNNLFRAPIFKHDSKHTDFLVVRRQTGVYGTNYHLRNIENLHVVGQQLPFAEVPGTHGRKVTSTQKARMKMIAFRIYAKKLKTRGRQPYVPHTVITLHFPGSDIAQNRSKMRELMQYNKEHGTWEPKPGDDKFLDMEFLRNEIKPEDICLIDSMQVGARQMQDAGFDTNQIDNDKDDTENQSLDAQLVHWRATKNFLAACGDNAMIALHGDGDPTGRGEALSFVKISMKGGFQPLGASVNEKIKGKEKTDASGHKYNVRDQEDAYQSAIRHIWDAQTNSLSTTEAPDLDVEMDDNIDARIERNERNNSVAAFGRTPRSEVPGTPRDYFPRQSDIDDGHSRVSGSHISASDRQMAAGDRLLRVTRRRLDQFGEWITETEIIDDPVVARQYKKKHDLQMKSKLDEQVRLGISGGTITPGAGSALSAAERKAAEEELLRLQKNKDRRKIREAQKAAKAALKDGTVVDGEGKVLPGQTQRKCANCGQYGHIKTNKKYVLSARDLANPSMLMIISGSAPC